MRGRVGRRALGSPARDARRRSARAPRPADARAQRARRGAALKRAAVAATALLLSGCALLLPQPSLRREIPRLEPAPSALWIGAGRAPLTPVDREVPLAGFGPNPKRTREVLVEADGTRHDLFARALSLSSPDGLDGSVDRFVLVAVESLVVTRDLRRAALRALEQRGNLAVSFLSRTEVVVAATHTHQGIGGFWKGTIPEWGAIGEHDPALVSRYAGAIAAAVESAVRTERPARLAVSRADAGDLVESRARPSNETDPELFALSAEDLDGAPIARLVVLGSHPTELYSVHQLSGAWPGSCARALERAGGTALVLQGGLGDARPHMGTRFPGKRIERSRGYGEEVARRALTALVTAPRDTTLPVRVARGTLDLPPPTLGLVPIPILDRLLAYPVVAGDWPSRTKLVAARLGTTLLAFAPFEATAPSILRAKGRLRRVGFQNTALVSLANDWLGYAPDTIPLFWNTSGSASFGGIGLGRLLAERTVEIGERIAPPR